MLQFHYGSGVQAVRPPAPARWSAEAGHDTARRLLRQAQGAVQKWPEGFAGFAARVTFRGGSDVEHGEVRLVPPSGVAIEGLGAGPRAFLERMLCEMTQACRPRFFDEDDGRFALVLETETPEGERLIRVHTPEADRLVWVLDARGFIRRSERTAGGVCTSTVFEAFVRTTPGRALPARVRRTRSDAATGALLRSELITDTFVRVSHAWLPATREVTVSDLAESRCIVLELRDHVLL